MRIVRLVGPLVLALAGLSGCILANLGTEERLRDAVVGYNDECRWGRIDLAAQRVVPGYRDQFRMSHFNWGRDFQIADSEIVHVETSGEEQEDAVSTVVVRWYDQTSLLLADTTLRQRWEKVRGGYVLLEESVVGGHPGLLEIPEELVPDDEAPGADESPIEGAQASL